jgi:hypothetical protein
VTWRFAAAAPGIVFDRRVPSNRHETWTPGDGLVWGLDEGGYETLRPAAGGEQRVFAARFATDERKVGRAPPLHRRFGDGARLVFTAQVAVHAQECGGTPARCRRRDVAGPRLWQLRARDPAMIVRVLDAAAAGALTWAEPPGDVRGTYVYVGRGEAGTGTGTVMVIDRTLPRWLDEETRTLLPRLVAFHGERTGLALDVTPLVLMSYDGRRPGDGVRGITLPALLQLEALGTAWRTPSADRRARWFELIAHESFHLWNSQLARRRGEKRDEWLSEGSAVYVAGLALAHAGLLAEPARAARLLDAANRCLATLRTGLHDEAADASYYACGEIVFFLIDRRLAGDGGAYGLLAAVFARARAGTAPGYDTGDLLELLAARTGGDDPVLADVRHILERGLGEKPAAFLVTALGRAGLSTAEVRGRAGAPPRLRLRSSRFLGRPVAGPRR